MPHYATNFTLSAQATSGTTFTVAYPTGLNRYTNTGGQYHYIIDASGVRKIFNADFSVSIGDTLTVTARTNIASGTGTFFYYVDAPVTQDVLATADSVSGNPSVLQSVGGALKMLDVSVPIGYDARFDVRDSASVWDHYAVTATGIVIAQPCLVKGLICQAGTSPTLVLYDNTAASGTPVFPAYVHTIGVPVIFAEGVAIHCPNGLYATLGGTGSPTFQVLARV